MPITPLGYSVMQPTNVISKFHESINISIEALAQSLVAGNSNAEEILRTRLVAGITPYEKQYIYAICDELIKNESTKTSGLVLRAALQCHGIGAIADLKEVFSQFEQATKNGETQAMYWLGYFYRHAGGNDKMLQASLALLSEAANRENIPAKVQLADMYFRGHGVVQDYQQSKNLCESAGDHTARALTMLGSLYYHGLGVERPSAITALYYFEKAAILGQPYAIYNLGALFYNNDGITRNLGIAQDYFEAAALYKHPESLQCLLQMVERGECVRSTLFG
jgi:TPR repeat protein